MQQQLKPLAPKVLPEEVTDILIDNCNAVSFELNTGTLPISPSGGEVTYSKKDYRVRIDMTVCQLNNLVKSIMDNSLKLRKAYKILESEQIKREDFLKKQMTLPMDSDTI